MKTIKHLDFPLAAMAAAMLAAYGSAWAQVDDEIAELAKPSSSIGVGLGYVSQDAPRFGIYSGMDDEGAYGLLNVDVNRRDDSTGTWLKFNGRNLGLEGRDMRISHEQQGNWAYYIDYSETPRFEPRTVRTTVTGIGSSRLGIPNTQQLNGQEVGLKMKREATTLGFNKQLGSGFDVNVRLRNEEKNGARLWGRGEGGAMEFMPEPINSTTQQLDATIGYTGERLHLTGGYYGSFYDNNNDALNIDGGTTATLQSAHNLIALPPDNEGHQLHFGGGYKFSATTKGTFKVSYARAAQNDTFIAPTGAGVNDLDARVDTTRLQMGITSRPMPKLALLANVSIDDREDKTPIRRYVNQSFNITGTQYYTGYNEPRSVKTSSGKLEASYRLPLDMRLTGGFDYVEKERDDIYDVRTTAFRKKTEEASWRLMLQRTMSETVSGSVEFVKSDRHGSQYLGTQQWNFGTNTLVTPALQSIMPIHLMDRDREKVKLSVSWTPVEALSLQFSADESYDNYDHRTAAQMGVRAGKANNYAIDASYAFADSWQATAWISRNENKTDQAGGPMTGGVNPGPNAWLVALRNTGNAFGLGLRGKPYDRLELGIDLSHAEVVDEYRMRVLNTGAVLATAPRDYFTRQSSVKLFGTYAIQKMSSIRLDYVYDRFHTSDWAWTSLTDPLTWTYRDGTQVTQRPKQNVNFVGVTYIYRFY
ncbi:MAG TPA: MtrB/PioB family decaheme-associated outer membrane protein [Noviherbaspirillum sp.]|nr:MtrB/PioB family decaheme-associated outer membrane protein [Noviherbaspirillum sp.]